MFHVQTIRSCLPLLCCLGRLVAFSSSFLIENKTKKSGVPESDKNKKPPWWFYRWTTNGGFLAAFKKTAGLFGLGPMPQFPPCFFTFSFFFLGYKLPIEG